MDMVTRSKERSVLSARFGQYRLILGVAGVQDRFAGREPIRSNAQDGIHNRVKFGGVHQNASLQKRGEFAMMGS